MAPTPNQIAKPESDAADTGAAVVEHGAVTPFEMSPDVARSLHGLNIDPRAVQAAAVPFFWKIGWPELCSIPTRDPKTTVSPVLVVVSRKEFPEAKEFEDYVGFCRCEAITEENEYIAFTTSMYYADSGEALPLYEFLKMNPMPFALRVMRQETRKPGRFVIRPTPLDVLAINGQK